MFAGNVTQCFVLGVKVTQVVKEGLFLSYAHFTYAIWPDGC